jgi:hypothetical protein
MIARFITTTVAIIVMLIAMSTMAIIFCGLVVDLIFHL